MSLFRVITVSVVIFAVLVALLIVVGALALGADRSPGADLGALPGQVADIPPTMLAIYATAGKQYGIDWAILGAIGKVESDHNRSTAAGVHSGVNFAGCCAGSMQISLAGGASSTWSYYKVDGNGDGAANIYDPADAVPAAAAYLKAAGAPGDYQRAIFAYNHAQWYVDEVQHIAAGYRALTQTPPTSVEPWQVIANPRITLSPIQRSDIAHGLIDPRIVSLLGLVAQTHTIYISALRSDHSEYTTSGNVSNHSAGRAVDIAMVDGAACTGTRNGTCGQLAIELAQLTGPLHLTELIYCFDPDGPANADAFAQADHCDHIHAGEDR